MPFRMSRLDGLSARPGWPIGPWRPLSIYPPTPCSSATIHQYQLAQRHPEETDNLATEVDDRPETVRLGDEPDGRYAQWASIRKVPLVLRDISFPVSLRAHGHGETYTVELLKMVLLERLEVGFCRSCPVFLGKVDRLIPCRGRLGDVECVLTRSANTCPTREMMRGERSGTYSEEGYEVTFKDPADQVLDKSTLFGTFRRCWPVY